MIIPSLKDDPSREDVVEHVRLLVDCETKILSESALVLGMILGTMSRADNYRPIEKNPGAASYIKFLKDAMKMQEDIFKRTYEYLDYLKDEK